MNNPAPKDKETAAAIDIRRRIHALRKMLKLSQKEFAETIGISQGHLSVIENGNNHPSDTLLLAICHRFKVLEEWLLGGKGNPFAEALPESGIPVYNQLPDSYPDRPMSAEIIGHLSLPSLPRNAFAFYQRGDYMAPTVQANDLMVFEPVEAIFNEDLVLIKNKWDTWIVRRYRTTKNRAMFTADNPAYREFEYDLGKQKLLAKVCAVLRYVNF